MRTSSLDNAVESSRKQSPTDSQLLKRFVASGDEGAFAQFVERHGAYIFGVCRRLLAHAQDAEDVFQASFLELARQASSVCERDSVAAWLQTVAVRMARRARNRRNLRQQREMAGTAKEPAVAPDDTTWLETRKILEEEIGHLPEELRSPIILCFFQGMTQEEASQSLGIKYRTLRARLVRGRAKLHKRLRRRGVTLAVLGAALTAESDGAVSVALSTSTVRAALAVARGAPLIEIASPAVVSLLGHKAILTTCIVAVALGLGLGGGATLLRSAGAVTDAAGQSSRRVLPDRSARTRDEAIVLARDADEKRQTADTPAKTQSRETVKRIAEDRQQNPQPSTKRRTPDSQRTQERADDLARLVKIAAAYTLKLESGGTAQVRRDPAFRWNNPPAETKDAALFFWMADDRPVALGTIIWYPKIGFMHEFQSLALEPLTAERGGEKIWQPATPGIKFAPLPDAPPPEATEAKRLVQMKTLASRFRAEVVKGPPAFPAGSIWQLRLLPKPLIRYGSTDRLARDGALFAFCQDTDPDVFLMLEVRGAGTDAAWNYALGPMTGWKATAWCDENVVWSQQELSAPKDPKLPYFVIGPSAGP